MYVGIYRHLDALSGKLKEGEGMLVGIYLYLVEISG